ncbi:MAG: phage portal protein [Clostridia bacterium]|nr:phage portal protein [Clostridia bacterium]
MVFLSKRKKNRNINSRDAPAAAAKQTGSGIYLCSDDAYKILCGDGYKPLSSCPEVQMAVNAYADTIASMTIHLMQNTDKGDVRVRNELSRLMDINPHPDMTRYQFIHNLVHVLMLEGEGNQVTVPIYKDGYLERLEPIAPSKVSILPPESGGRYRILANGIPLNPDEVLHFVLNPDPEEPYKGRGYTIGLRDVVKSIRQATATKQALMENPTPSIIVKVDGLDESLQTPEGREKLSNQYLAKTENGRPWMIPADTLEITQVKPLTLNDLAIKTNLELDKRSIAALLKVPGFMVGVGEFDAKAFDWFVSVPCMKPAKIVEQELTKKTLISPDWYWRMNNRSLLNYDVEKVVNVGKELVDRATMRRNELRDWLGLPPDPEMDDVLILENYLRKNKNDLDETGGDGDA